jgi:hypothetical protein
MSTLTFIRRLPSYSIRRGGHFIDPYVSSILEKSLDSATLESLSDYTRGMYSLDLHYSALKHYDRPLAEENRRCSFVRTDPLYRQAFEHVRKLLRLDTPAEAIPLNTMDDIPYIGSSAAGYGYHGNKRDNYHLARSRAWATIRMYQDKNPNFKYVPDKAFTRTQLSSISNPKIRHIWGKSFHNLLLEGSSAYPLNQAYLKIDSPMYIGVNLYKEMPWRILRLFAKESNSTAYCLDWSRFDMNVNSAQIEDAFSILKENIRFPTKMEEDAFDFTAEHFINTPIVMPDGKLFLCSTGIPSGSYYTQLVDSIVNLIFITWLLLRQGLNPPLIYVLGDDSIFAIIKTLRFDLDIAASDAAILGWLLHPDKCIVTSTWTDVHFLGHHFYGSSLYREDFLCLTLALFTEDPVQHYAHSITRIRGLLVDCGFNSFYLYQLLQLMLAHYGDPVPTLEFPFVKEEAPFIKTFCLS